MISSALPCSRAVSRITLRSRSRTAGSTEAEFRKAGFVAAMCMAICLPAYRVSRHPHRIPEPPERRFYPGFLLCCYEYKWQHALLNADLLHPAQAHVFANRRDQVGQGFLNRFTVTVISRSQLFNRRSLGQSKFSRFANKGLELRVPGEEIGFGVNFKNHRAGAGFGNRNEALSRRPS